MSCDVLSNSLSFNADVLVKLLYDPMKKNGVCNVSRIIPDGLEGKLLKVGLFVEPSRVPDRFEPPSRCQLLAVAYYSTGD